jgi:hypothetical protein
MPKLSSIEEHEDKQLILQDIIDGKKLREISEKYKVSISSIHRYAQKQLAEQAAEAYTVKRLEQGDFTLDRLGNYLAKGEKLLDACTDYLKDPLDPDKFYLGPRAHEIEVIYYVEYEGENGQPIREKHKDTLQNLLAEIAGNDLVVEKVQYKHTDPRSLLVSVSNSLSKQLALVANINGQIESNVININVLTLIEGFTKTIMTELAEHPELREKIGNKIRTITEGV